MPHDDDEEDRQRRREAKQLQKELETPEEKYRRRMEKKTKKAERKSKDEALLGYTNESNPFGDANLSESFVWKKKVDKLAEEGTHHRVGLQCC